MSWIRIENRLDVSLLILIFKMILLNLDRHMLFLLNSYEKIRLIVRFEMNSRNDFVECQIDFVYPQLAITNDWTTLTDPVINHLIPLSFRFVVIYTPVLI